MEDERIEKSSYASSSSSGELGGLFFQRRYEEEVFHFKSIRAFISSPVKRSICNASSRSIEIAFTFSFCDENFFESKVVFQESDKVPWTLSMDSLKDDISWKRLLFSLGMSVLPWFWMGFGTKYIKISQEIASDIGLNREMMLYWEEVYRNILTEFLYLHPLLPIHGSVSISCDESYNFSDDLVFSGKQSAVNTSETRGEGDERVLVPLGGGKDSLVVWDRTISSGKDPVLLYVSDGYDEFQRNWRLPEITKIAASPVMIVKHCFVDSAFIHQAKSYLRPAGHPWAAVVFFDALIASRLTGIAVVSLGHERSANEGNGVFFGDIEVNHQYDKSEPFIVLSDEYARRHLGLSLKIETPLSSLWELEIVKMFSDSDRLRPFARLFLSCNEPVNGSEWCWKCEKCAFILLLFSAWLGPKRAVAEMFPGCSMMSDESCVKAFLSLLGNNGAKPFDCVGTVHEVKCAVKMAARRAMLESGELPCILREMCVYAGLSEESFAERTETDDLRMIEEELGIIVNSS